MTPFVETDKKPEGDNQRTGPLSRPAETAINYGQVQVCG